MSVAVVKSSLEVCDIIYLAKYMDRFYIFIIIVNCTFFQLSYILRLRALY